VPSVKASSVMDTAGATARTGAVVALKPVELAKSRLGSLPDPLRRRLAWTMAVDTLAALSAAVDQVVVVSEQPALEFRLRHLAPRVTVLAEPGPVGMNGALSYGATALRESGCAVVLACVGDLPALRPDSVARVLAAAGGHPRSFLADASGVGTTMLVARRTELDPRFQGSSAAAHRSSGAVDLSDEALGGPLPDARRDVDTETELLEAVPLGLGRSTTSLVDPDTGAPGRYDSVTVTDQRTPDGAQLVITSSGHRRSLPAAALQDGLRQVHSGQRLHAVTSATAVLAAWL
jgi:2-phospho-L-lactate guanylyltransferase